MMNSTSERSISPRKTTIFSSVPMYSAGTRVASGPWKRIQASGWIARIFLIHSMSVGLASTTAWIT